MKLKTMLKFLLCFFIISVFSFDFSIAAPSVSHFFGKGNVATLDNYELFYHIQSLVMLFGTFLAVIVILVYSIQWVTATASRRQELKAGLWPLVIGIVLLVIGPKLVVGLYNSLLITGGSLAGDAEEIAVNIISIVRAIGYVMASVMILLVAIQWTTANSNKRQELKSRMVNIVIGATLMVAGVTILGLVAKFAEDSKSSVVTGELESPDRYCCVEVNKYKKL